MGLELGEFKFSFLILLKANKSKIILNFLFEFYTLRGLNPLEVVFRCQSFNYGFKEKGRKGKREKKISFSIYFNNL